MLFPVEISAFSIDSATNAPLVVLREKSGGRTISISVGAVEASAIAIKTLNVATDTPLTVDLISTAVKALGGTIDKIVFYDVVDSVLRARMHIHSSTGVILLDLRPGDALMLCVRSAVALFIDETVFEKSAGENSLSDRDKLRQHISQMDVLDFGRYYVE